METKYVCLLLITALTFLSCQPFDSFPDEVEDSGFKINILNYSEISYTGCTFYVGAIDENNKFIALDSLEFPNQYIKNRNEETKIDGFDGRKYGLTEPFREWSFKLTKFNTWAPPTRDQIEAITPKGEISFKLSLNKGQSNVFETFKYSIININAVISEDGTIR